MNLRKLALATGSIAIGAALGRKARQLLRQALHPPSIHGHGALVGRECVITTLQVNDRFGQARCEDGGAGLLLSVRCHKKNDLTRGRLARITAHHPGSDTYEVAPL
jgi:hypothetical protein